MPLSDFFRRLRVKRQRCGGCVCYHEMCGRRFGFCDQGSTVVLAKLGRYPMAARRWPACRDYKEPCSENSRA